MCVFVHVGINAKFREDRKLFRVLSNLNFLAIKYTKGTHDAMMSHLEDNESITTLVSFLSLPQ